MMYKKILLPISAIAFLLVMIAWMAGMFDDKVTPGQTSLTPATSNSSSLFIVKTEYQPISESAAASLEAKQSTLVSARIMAVINSIKVRAGEQVRRGDLLIQLDQTDLQARVSQAQSQIAAIEARLKEAKLQRNRADELHKQGVIAVADLDKARANHDSLRADRSAAQQQLLEAKTAADFADIRAPIDGKVIDRLAEPGDTAQPGAPLLAIYNPASLRVEAYVREELAMQLTIGDSIKAKIPALNKIVKAVVEERVPAAQPGSRALLVKARIETGAAELYAGLYAELLIPAGKEELILLPPEYIAEIGQLNMVWVVSDNSIERRFVRTGKHMEDGRIQIVNGLNAGEKLLPRPDIETQQQ